MLTIFTVPKPFSGHIGDIQQIAVDSWRALGSDIQILLVGDEDGVEEAARETGVQHVGGLARNRRGTPRLDSAFECVARHARWSTWCFVNADIVLLDDFVPTVQRVGARFSDFLMVGETRDLDAAAGVGVRRPTARSQLREHALERGRLRGYAALDYFVFRRGLFDPVPPFLIGRACFDNWLVWRARERRRPVVDATRSVVAVHQTHDYSHVAGGLDEAYYGDEARLNEQLAGGREHIYSLHDATHRVYRHGPPVRYWGSVLRLREKARVARASAELHFSARRARRDDPGPEARPLRILGVASQPSAATSLLLDFVARDEDVDLTALYATPGEHGASFPDPLGHKHLFVRSIRIAAVDRALGRDYPITWAIWHTLHVLRPDCVVISGWSTYPAQAAVGWCVARRHPFILLTDRATGLGDEQVRGPVSGAVVRSSVGVVASDAPDARAQLAELIKGVRDSLRPRARRLRNRSEGHDRHECADRPDPPPDAESSPSS